MENEIKALPLKCEWGEEQVVVRVDSYIATRGLYIELLHKDGKSYEPFADMTVCIPEYSLEPKHNIDTLEQLETYRQALQTEIGQLQTKRKQLPKTDDVQSQHKSVTAALKQLRQEERLCRKIAEHSLEVQQHLTEARRDRAEQQKQEQERARDRRPDITTR